MRHISVFQFITLLRFLCILSPFFFYVPPVALVMEAEEIKPELRLASEGWLQENMLHTFGDSKANAHISKLWMIIAAIIRAIFSSLQNASTPSIY